MSYFETLAYERRQVGELKKEVDHYNYVIKCILCELKHINKKRKSEKIKLGLSELIKFIEDLKN